MTIKRIYLDKQDFNMDSGNISFKGDTCHYISKVLRMRKGDVFYGFDGSGKEYKIEICGCGKRMAEGTIIDSKQVSGTELPFELTLFQSIPKGNKMDSIIGDISQLGVQRIVPVFSRRVIGLFSEGKAASKIERWKKISAASSSVSGRQMITEIGDSTTFSEALEFKTDISLLFWEEKAENLRKAIRKPAGKEFMSVKIFVGPEGGYTEEEVEKARSCNVSIASLGKRILKVETASVIAAALTIYELENS
ncbi:MAG TPA: RsmE family RNA methyltransferase [bacterium]|nr:RsmE family RNA methyltransferase [bacterium]